MAEAAATRAPALVVEGLEVYYGHAHVLQDVALRLDHGVLSIVGRNGMGKTTLCRTIMGMTPAAGGSIKAAGQQILGLPSNEIVARGEGVHLSARDQVEVARDGLLEARRRHGELERVARVVRHRKVADHP